MDFGGFATGLKDYFFPYYCAECGKEGEWWCVNCRGQIKSMKFRAANGIESVTALFNYKESSPIGSLIKKFKYNFVKDLKDLFEDIISDTIIDFPDDAVLIPVPLYKKRESERGFNQALVIAEIISRKTGCLVEKNTLVRVRKTEQQARLGLKERFKNVESAFDLATGEAPEKVILVDDVYTTGATMAECARILRKNGSREVFGFVLAHGQG